MHKVVKTYIPKTDPVPKNKQQTGTRTINKA